MPFGAGSMIYASLPSGNTDNWAPTGWVPGVDAIVIAAPVGETANLVGLTGGASDRRVTLANQYSSGIGTITISPAASSTNANQFYTPGSATITINSDGAVAFEYDAVGDTGGSGPGYGPGWRIVLPGAGASPPPPPLPAFYVAGIQSNSD